MNGTICLVVVGESKPLPCSDGYRHWRRGREARWALPQWQKSDETTKRFCGSARYVLNNFPYTASFPSFNAPTSTGTMVNWSFLLSITCMCHMTWSHEHHMTRGSPWQWRAGASLYCVPLHQSFATFAQTIHWIVILYRLMENTTHIQSVFSLGGGCLCVHRHYTENSSNKYICIISMVCLPPSQGEGCDQRVRWLTGLVNGEVIERSLVGSSRGQCTARQIHMVGGAKDKYTFSAT